jgi:lipopolysaccharide export system permease protein
LFLTILLDLLNNLPKYADRAAQRGLGGFDLAFYLGGYYLRLLPVLFVTMAPFVTVIACMFSVARLQAANEIVPMLFVGRSIHRILRPMLLCGVLAGGAMMACWQWVVPHIGASIAADEAFLREGSAVQKVLVLETFGELDQRLYVNVYDPEARRMSGVGMLCSSLGETDNYLIEAAHAEWDVAKGDWRLVDGRLQRRLATRGQGIESRPQEWLERPDLTPEVLLQQGRESLDPETQSYSELLATLQARPNLTTVTLALHRHFTYPLANILLLLLALPLAVYFERGSRIERILGAIGLCGAYMLVDLVCQSLGGKGHLNPIVAAWTPTILFGALGITLFGSTKT